MTLKITCKITIFCLARYNTCQNAKDNKGTDAQPHFYMINMIF